MEKKDYCLSFVETIKEKSKEGLYKFFTKKSVIVDMFSDSLPSHFEMRIGYPRIS